MEIEDLEGLARWVLDSAQIDDAEPVDAYVIIDWLDMEVVHRGGVGGKRGPGIIELGVRTPIRQIHSVLAHEGSHEILHRYGPVNDERCAKAVAARILAPTRRLERQLREGWNLYQIMAANVNASGELLGRRVAEMRAASFAVYDQGRERYRIAQGPRLSIEAEMVREAFESGRPARDNSTTGAWPIFTGYRRRVIVITDHST